MMDGNNTGKGSRLRRRRLISGCCELCTAMENYCELAATVTWHLDFEFPHGAGQVCENPKLR